MNIQRILVGLLALAVLLMPAATLAKETPAARHQAAAHAPVLIAGPILPIDGGFDAQHLPAVASNPHCPANQQFLVAYQSRVSGTNNDIWGRYAQGGGAFAGPGPFQLTANPAEQQAPAVAYNQFGGNYLVVWMGSQGGNWEIYAQLWNCQKQPVSPLVNVTHNTATQVYPDVICGYNICWVVWQDLRNGNWEIYGQRLNGVGALIGGNQRITANLAAQGAPAIAYNPEPNGCAAASFLVVWEDMRNVGNGYDIYSQQLNNLGLCGGNVPIYVGARDQREPDVAYGTANDRYQAVWHDYRNSAAPDIYARMVAPNGAVGAQAAISTATDAQSRPAIAYSSAANQFLTCWEDHASGNWDVRCRPTNGLGAPGAIFALVATAPQQRHPAIAYNTATGHFFVAWDSGGTDIYGRAP
jgi:hypothetical protein